MDYNAKKNGLEIMVDTALFNSTDTVINSTLGDVPPSTIIYTAGYTNIKQKDFDGSWVEVQ